MTGHLLDFFPKMYIQGISYEKPKARRIVYGPVDNVHRDRLVASLISS